jgi:ParB-like chromosome segregation protein Spo0J
MNQPVTPTGEVHPAANVFPMIDGDEFEALVESIKDHGLSEPIWLTPDGVLLDGRNRLAACQAAGVPPAFRIYDGDDLVDFIVRLNIHRRHLTNGQKALAAVDLLPIYEAESKATQGARTDLNIQADLPTSSATRRQSRDKAAAAVGSTGRAVGQAKRVTEKAPDLAEKVRSGEVALDAAERQLKRRLREQSEQEARTIVAADIPVDAEGPGWRLMAGDFRDRLNDLPDGSVDLIVTDPPYPREFLHLWEDLAKHAARVLKPQGVLLGLTGQIMLPEVMDRVGAHLQYGWVYCQPMPAEAGSNSRIMARHVLQTWKPWLAYCNGPWPSGNVDWHEDTLSPSARTKNVFRWEQHAAPAEYLIEVLSAPGQIILDPFTGAGTYGQAALSRGRTFIGIEQDDARFKAAQARLEGLS